MKRIFTLIMICSVMLASVTTAAAQHATLRYADQQFALSNYMEAAKGYKKAYDKKASYQAAKGAANSHESLSSYKEAYDWWKLAVNFEAATADDYSHYIFAIHQAGNFEELKSTLENRPDNWESKKGSFNMDSLLMWYSSPKNIKLVSLEAVNSSSTDYGLTFDRKGNTYFSSDRGTVSPAGKKAIRLDGANKFSTEKYDMTGRDFISIYKQNGENQVMPIQSVVPNAYHFSDPFFMKEKPIVFYSLTRDLEKVKKKRKYSIYPEVYYSTINEKGELVDYHPFPINSALTHGVITPFVDEQEKKIYFSSNRSGGFGGYDLYYVTYDGDFNFGSPINLGPNINSEGDERDPFLIAGRFYFSSNGQVGLGGLDIFQASYENGGFSPVKNLGLPYNSPQDDFALIKTEEGKTFISSNRMDGTGLDDIYKIEDLNRHFLGNVIDVAGNPITEGLVAELTQKDNLLTIKTLQQNGTLSADLSPEADFRLTLTKPGYFTITDKELTTRGMKIEQLEKEYVMRKIPYNTEVFEDMIYYDYGESEIRADAEPTMEKVAETMKQFTFLKILVRSHTDSRSSNAFNEALSERRANAVRDFLGNYGIARTRVKSEWFGEEQLLNDCGEGVPCPDSAHQLNRRSKLILIAFPDEEKTYEYPSELEGIDFSAFEEVNLTSDHL